MGRILRVAVLTAVALGLFTGPALACGALVSPNGTVQLGRTVTLAAYHNGIEHYLTEFTFNGSGSKFGSIVPLPARPTHVIQAGRWTLQRLELEVNPPIFGAERASSLAPTAAADTVQVILKAKVAALDVTVVKGGGTAVGLWAKQHGFFLSPDAPAVLDFYGRRSPYFMAVEFNAKRAAALGQQQGQATAVHVVIPTNRPWVPLRILGLGSKPNARIDADVFLLNDRAPALLPNPGSLFTQGGLELAKSEAASSQLLKDLSSDRGMHWMPTSGMWLDYIKIHSSAQALRYDLAIDPSGGNDPSPVDAGLAAPGAPLPSSSTLWPIWVGLAIAGMFVIAGAAQRSRMRAAQ
jgi:hypothetical protein